MVKIISETPKKKIGKRLIIWVVVIIVLLGAGAAAWYVTHQAAPAKKASNTDTSVTNPQSASVQKAAEAATTQLNSGDAKGAIQTLGEAAASTTDQSDKATLYAQQASVYIQNGQNDAAVTASKQAIQANPTDWKNYANLGFLYESMGNKQSAIDYLNQALTVMKQQSDQSSASEIKGAISRLEASK
jgi:tetratricopeptide (TPR) repeat protein